VPGTEDKSTNYFLNILRKQIHSARKIFLLSVYIKYAYVKCEIRWRGVELRLSTILALALMLSACNACAFGAPGSVVVDIVGSVTDNTKITSSGLEKVELEIIGSEANNTIISSPAEKAVICPKYVSPDIKCPDAKCQSKQKCHPWENMHLGVDAWYGTFWYTDINMPKWPQT
jgi:hypothetical protein